MQNLKISSTTVEDAQILLDFWQANQPPQKDEISLSPFKSDFAPIILDRNVNKQTKKRKITSLTPTQLYEGQEIIEETLLSGKLIKVSKHFPDETVHLVTQVDKIVVPKIFKPSKEKPASSFEDCLYSFPQKDWQEKNKPSAHPNIAINNENSFHLFHTPKKHSIFLDTSKPLFSPPILPDQEIAKNISFNFSEPSQIPLNRNPLINSRLLENKQQINEIAIDFFRKNISRDRKNSKIKKIFGLLTCEKGSNFFRYPLMILCTNLTDSIQEIKFQTFNLTDGPTLVVEKDKGTHSNAVALSLKPNEKKYIILKFELEKGKVIQDYTTHAFKNKRSILTLTSGNFSLQYHLWFAGKNCNSKERNERTAYTFNAQNEIDHKMERCMSDLYSN